VNIPDERERGVPEGFGDTGIVAGHGANLVPAQLRREGKCPRPGKRGDEQKSVAKRRYRLGGARLPLSLIEFPADDAERARRFWVELLGVELEARQEGEGEGWQTHSGAPAVGVHVRGDSFSLPYFAVSDIAKALERVEALGGTVVHPGEAWAICKDSERSPFGLAQESLGA
jgi:predicted enzyme related to lactoylglutathione lyase